MSDTLAEAGLLPKRQRGCQSAAATARYELEVAKFCRLILQIKSTMEFAVGSRGWCAASSVPPSAC
jgi:hypothetical protein